MPAQLARKFSMPIVPIYIERIKGINFKITIDKPLYFTNDTSIKKITDELNEIIEKKVILNPGQWIWSHNRWK